MRFSDQFMDQIRARIPVSSVVGKAVQWDRRKTNAGRGDYWACCPFHHEKTPSFHADDRQGRYYCFGCKASGDIFRFLTEKHGLPFPEAVEQLACEAGLEIPKQTPQEIERQQKRASLYDVMALAQQFFEKQLQEPVGAAARGYLSDRELSTKVQQQFQIGYAPADRYALKTFLTENKISGEQMVEAGLLVAGEDIAVPYDRFRDRIIFPICDPRGRVIAFGGRAMNPDVPAKYLNSPETPLFHKSAVLYNLDKARQSAYDGSAIIAVEGYMDVIAMSRAGFSNTVAPLGTALTDQQLHMMWRIAPEPVLCFDGDKAGLSAAWRAVDLALPLLKPGHSLRIAFLPDGQDPDDLLKSEGAAAIEQVIETALPLSETLWQRALERNDRSTPERRAQFEADLEQSVHQIQDTKVRDHYKNSFRQRLRDLWQKSGGRNTARRAGGKFTSGSKNRKSWAARNKPEWQQHLPASRELMGLTRSARPTQTLERREQQIILVVLNHPEILEDHDEVFAELELASKELDKLRREIIDVAALNVGLDSSALKDHLSNRGLSDLLKNTEKQAQRLNSWFLEADAATHDAMTGFMHMIALHRKTVTLERELREAERALAESPTEENLSHLNEIREQLRSSQGEEAIIEGFGEASGRSVDALS
jgi:DNA primase